MEPNAAQAVADHRRSAVRTLILPRYALEAGAGDPREFGPYPVVGRLGASGICPAYLSRSPDGRWVALHTPHPRYRDRGDLLDRFRREARRVRALDDPHLTAVLDGDWTGAIPYLVTEFADGPTLDAEVATRGPLSGTDLRRLVVAVAAAVAAFDRAGIVHGGLAPSDVILDMTRPRIVDLGLARALRPLVEPGDQNGPGRPPPTAADDVFSWGALVNYAATGQFPMAAAKRPTETRKGPKTRRGTDTDGPVPWALVSRSLADDPAGRPTPTDLVAILAAPTLASRATPGLATASRETPGPRRQQRHMHRSPASARDRAAPPAVGAPGMGDPGAADPGAAAGPAKAGRSSRARAAIVVALVVAVAGAATAVAVAVSASPSRAPAGAPVTSAPVTSALATGTPASGGPVPSAASPSPSAPLPLTVTNVSVNGMGVTPDRTVTVLGPLAAQTLRGRISGSMSPGSQLFVISTPSGTASYVQGEIHPDAGGDWSVTVSIASDGTYSQRPDRISVILVDQRTAALLRADEGPPGARPILPAFAFTAVTHVDILKIPA
jgi:eukaryotic-like serine/threonine-protein kinase